MICKTTPGVILLEIKETTITVTVTHVKNSNIHKKIIQKI